MISTKTVSEADARPAAVHQRVDGATERPVSTWNHLRLDERLVAQGTRDGRAVVGVVEEVVLRPEVDRAALVAPDEALVLDEHGAAGGDEVDLFQRDRERVAEHLQQLRRLWLVGVVNG